ncbi:MAG TPA: M15 family metallopeptidase [Desulfuromonadales bacterium]|nr:M15 family metallopeptidase [Desulfuromonadales bacterium]
MPENSERFVDVKEFISSIRIDIRYCTTNNFVGSRIDGYDGPKCLLTREAAEALKKVQEELVQKGLSLKIFDAYRPLRAIAHFARWAKDPSDQKMKSENYPSTNKEDLFRDGYISPKSGHSRGSTVDLTLVDLKTDQELDMGTSFDFFDPLSDTDNSRITKTHHENRMTLKSVMERHGFESLKREWWHFTLRNEPYPGTYFDFKIE